MAAAPLHPPTPPSSPTLSHVTVVHERAQLEKVNRWRGSENKVNRDFPQKKKKKKYMRDLRRKWLLPPKHSITRNYNNSTLEDGLFNFIMRFSLSCLSTERRGALKTVNRDYVNQILGLSSECLHFPPFIY